MGLKIKKVPKQQKSNYKILKNFRHNTPENMYCADCGAKEPKYASVNLGVFICSKCSHLHQLLGPQVSVVKSIETDIWTAEEMQNFLIMGNANAKQIYGAVVRNRPVTLDYLRQKYDSLSFVQEENKRNSLINKRKTFFGNYNQSQASSSDVDYETKYLNEMEQLISMGFTKKKYNLKALILTKGNVQKATDLIINAQAKHQEKKTLYSTMEYNPTSQESETIEQIENMGFNIKSNTKTLLLIRKYDNNVEKIIEYLLNKNDDKHLKSSRSVTSLSSYSSSNPSETSINESEVITNEMDELTITSGASSSSHPPYPMVQNNDSSNGNNDNYDFFNSIDTSSTTQPSNPIIKPPPTNPNQKRNSSIVMNNDDISSIFSANLQSPLSMNSQGNFNSFSPKSSNFTYSSNNTNAMNYGMDRMGSPSGMGTSSNQFQSSPTQQNSYSMNNNPLSPQLSSPGQMNSQQNSFMNSSIVSPQFSNNSSSSPQLSSPQYSSLNRNNNQNYPLSSMQQQQQQQQMQFMQQQQQQQNILPAPMMPNNSFTTNSINKANTIATSTISNNSNNNNNNYIKSVNDSFDPFNNSSNNHSNNNDFINNHSTALVPTNKNNMMIVSNSMNRPSHNTNNDILKDSLIHNYNVNNPNATNYPMMYGGGGGGGNMNNSQTFGNTSQNNSQVFHSGTQIYGNTNTNTMSNNNSLGYSSTISTPSAAAYYSNNADNRMRMFQSNNSTTTIPENSNYITSSNGMTNNTSGSNSKIFSSNNPFAKQLEKEMSMSMSNQNVNMNYNQTNNYNTSHNPTIPQNTTNLLESIENPFL